MKKFFELFMTNFVLVLIFLCFSSLIFESVIASVALIAFIISIVINSFIDQETRIEALEERIKALENQDETKE